MRKYLLYLFSLSFLPTVAIAQSKPNAETLFDQINTFMVNEVVFGLVDYQGLADDPAELNLLTDQIAAYVLKGTSQDHKTAFYINAYNLLVIKQIAENYPIKSPLEVDGFFKKRKFTVANEELTLDQIEFDKLFKPTQDPRIHFVLGCGAMSCPFLYDNAFIPEKLQEQLKFRAEIIIERPNYVFVDEQTRTVTLNKIFDWYKDQFVSSAGSLIQFINRYRFYKIEEDFTIEYQEYDWSVNNR